MFYKWSNSLLETVHKKCRVILIKNKAILAKKNRLHPLKVADFTSSSKNWQIFEIWNKKIHKLVTMEGTKHFFNLVPLIDHNGEVLWKKEGKNPFLRICQGRLLFYSNMYCTLLAYCIIWWYDVGSQLISSLYQVSTICQPPCYPPPIPHPPPKTAWRYLGVNVYREIGHGRRKITQIFVTLVRFIRGHSQNNMREEE